MACVEFTRYTMKSLVRGLELNSRGNPETTLGLVPVESPILKQNTLVPAGLFACRLTVAGKPCIVMLKTEPESKTKMIVMHFFTTNSFNYIGSFSECNNFFF